jgi:transposase
MKSWTSKLAQKVCEGKPYMNKDFLINEYVIAGKSVRQLRKEYGWGTNTIKRWLRFYNIPIRQLGSNRVSEQQRNGRLKYLHGRT